MVNSHSARSPKKYSREEALAKIQSYCAYQERSHKEVKNKLFTYGLLRDEVDEIMSNLIVSGFLNEERYAKAFAGGKFRIKKWGRLKIQLELESQGLTKNCINRGLQEIEPADYLRTLRILLEKKMEATEEDNIFKKRNKIAGYAISRGYESDLVWEEVKRILPD